MPTSVRWNENSGTSNSTFAMYALNNRHTYLALKSEASGKSHTRLWLFEHIQHILGENKEEWNTKDSLIKPLISSKSICIRSKLNWNYNTHKQNILAWNALSAMLSLTHTTHIWPGMPRQLCSSRNEETQGANSRSEGRSFQPRASLQGEPEKTYS